MGQYSVQIRAPNGSLLNANQQIVGLKVSSGNMMPDTEGPLDYWQVKHYNQH